MDEKNKKKKKLYEETVEKKTRFAPPSSLRATSVQSREAPMLLVAKWRHAIALHPYWLQCTHIGFNGTLFFFSGTMISSIPCEHFFFCVNPILVSWATYIIGCPLGPCIASHFSYEMYCENS